MIIIIQHINVFNPFNVVRANNYLMLHRTIVLQPHNVCRYMYVHMDVCAYECACMWMCVHVDVYACGCAHMWMCGHVDVHACGCACMWMYVHMDVCTYGCMCITDASTYLRPSVSLSVSLSACLFLQMLTKNEIVK